MTNPSISEAHSAIDAALRRGNYFLAYDMAMAALEGTPNDVTLKYMAVLCLLRGGALSSAEALFKTLKLDDITTKNEDVLSLRGRILKARAEREKQSSPDLYRAAAQGYETAFQATGGSYSGVNAASLWYLAGDKEKARSLAENILIQPSKDQTAQAQYYLHATQAECHFLCGNMELAAQAMSEAITADPDNYAARASTIRQFRLLCGGDVPDWLKPYAAPPSIHYTGHMFRIGTSGQDRSLTPAEFEALESDISAYFEINPIGAAFGSLAAGADILFAENCVARGIDLHVILPVPIEDYCALSVTPLGQDWVARFEAILPKANSVEIILDEPGGFDLYDLKMTSLFAMGRARLHAERLCTQAYQLSLLESSAAKDKTQTYKDEDMWRASGGKVVNIAWPGEVGRTPVAPLPDPDRRAFRAMLFTDLKGYGRMSDRSVPDIVEEIFVPMAATCRALKVQPLQLKSWGDGLFLVFEDIQGATQAAFALMDCFNRQILELGEPLSLRIGAHFGPVWERPDPFMQSENFYGRHVAIAARLEAMAMPGSIYTSEIFAAVLAMQTGRESSICCDYVGQLQSEKETKSFPTYSLRH